MKIVINDIHEDNVQFSSKYGIGRGIWKDEMPQTNQEYFVEFEIRNVFDINEVKVSKSERCSLEFVNGKNLLTMQLIDYDDEGCATFMFGDSIVDVETKYDGRFLELKNQYLTFIVKDLYLYNMDI